MAIGVGALCSAPVRRLRKTIPDLIPKKYLDHLHIMEVLMDSRENHKKYRESLKICPSPAVPYFGMSFIIFRQNRVCTLHTQPFRYIVTTVSYAQNLKHHNADF